MACVEFDISVPPIPPFFINPPLVPNLPLPLDISVFCCKFSIPDVIGANAAIAIANAAIVLIGGEANAVVAAVEAEVLAALSPILSLSLSLKLDCPLD